MGASPHLARITASVSTCEPGGGGRCCSTTLRRVAAQAIESERNASGGTEFHVPVPNKRQVLTHALAICRRVAKLSLRPPRTTRPSACLAAVAARTREAASKFMLSLAPVVTPRWR